MDSIGDGELFILLPIILLVFCLILVPVVFFILTLRKALLRCAQQSRTMEPDHVWFLLIPFFNIVWQFIVVTRMSVSLANEYRRRNLPIEPEPGKTLGITFCVLNLCGWIPIIGIFTGIAGLVCWIVYWVKIAGFSEKLAMPYTPPAPVQ